MIFGEKALNRVDPLTLTALQTAASLGMAALCALFLDGGVHLAAATPTIWATIFYLALGCTVAGYLLQNAALGGLSSRTVVTAAFSYFLLGERLSTAGLVGAGIILACVVVETKMKEPE